jgi:hypothetical protein
MADRWQFEKVGLGYRVTADRLQTEIRVTRIKRSSSELHGDLRISTNIAGIKTIDGVMHMARFNLSSSTTRNSLSKLLESRTPKETKMDWYDGLEALCQKVMLAEMIGQPYVATGDVPLNGDRPPRHAIDPLVPARVTSLLYGPGGSGKSVIALACAMSVLSNHAIIPGFLPGITGPVLYLDWETDVSVVNERAQSIAKGCGLASPPITYRRCIRPLAEEAEEIANAVAEREIVYLVIDSAGMAIGAGGDRSDANESTLRLFDAIRHIGVTTQIIDHVSKQEMKTANGKALMPYGSIYKINLARSAWELRNTSEGESNSISLIHAKANDSRLHAPINLVINWQPDCITFLESEPTLEPYAPKDDGDRASQIVAYLQTKIWASMHEIAMATGIPYGTVKPVMTVRKSRDLFTRREIDGKYGLAENEAEVEEPWYSK